MPNTASAGAAQSAETVRVVLNGAPAEAGSGSLQDLLDANGFAGIKVATAVNGTFVPARSRTTHQLAPGDQIEVVSARQGG